MSTRSVIPSLHTCPLVSSSAAMHEGRDSSLSAWTVAGVSVEALGLSAGLEGSRWSIGGNRKARGRFQPRLGFWASCLLQVSFARHSEVPFQRMHNPGVRHLARDQPVPPTDSIFKLSQTWLNKLTFQPYPRHCRLGARFNSLSISLS